MPRHIPEQEPELEALCQTLEDKAISAFVLSQAHDYTLSARASRDGVEVFVRIANEYGTSYPLFCLAYTLLLNLHYCLTATATTAGDWREVRHVQRAVWRHLFHRVMRRWTLHWMVGMSLAIQTTLMSELNRVVWGCFRLIRGTK